MKITEIWPTLAGVAHAVFFRVTVTGTVVPAWPAFWETLETTGFGEMVNGEAVLLEKAPADVDPAMEIATFGMAAPVASDEGSVKITLRAVAAVVAAAFGVTVVAEKATGVPLPAGRVIVTVTLAARPSMPAAFNWTVWPA
jgi:hypothetical protein